MTVSKGTESFVLGNEELTHSFAPVCHHAARSHEGDHYRDETRLKVAGYSHFILVCFTENRYENQELTVQYTLCQ